MDHTPLKAKRILTPEWRKRISDAHKGKKKPRTKEHQEKLNIAHTGKKASEEHRAKLSKSHMGKRPSEATRKKMSLAISGEKHPMFGKKHSKETKEKQRLAKLNKPTRFWLGKTGEQSVNWMGGKSFEIYPREWSKTLRLSIRQRDGFACAICHIKESERPLAVHHIDYNKHNCDPLNLITLCNKCHSKTNVKRDYWIQYFYKKRYG